MHLLLPLLLLCSSPLFALRAQSPSFDLVIRNGRIIDGTGSPWYAGDVGIRDGRIAAIGRLEGAKAKRTVDAGGSGGGARVHRHAGPVGARASW